MIKEKLVGLVSFGILLTVMVCMPLSADDGKSAKDLHDFNCSGCHDESMYSRKNSIIKSLESLKTQVQRCETTLDLGWFEEEVNSVANYLNGKHYHYK